MTASFRIGKILVTVALLARPSAGQGTAPADPITPLAMKPGAPAGSFPLSGFESVNLFNGNLNFALPLLHIQGRGEAEMTLTLAIERHWQLRVVSPETTGNPAKYEAQAMEDGRPRYGGAMFRRIAQQDLQFQSSRLTFHHSLTRLTFMAPDGTETDFRDAVSDGQPKSWRTGLAAFNRGRTWLSRDGSAARFTASADVLDPGEEVVGYPTSFIAGQLQLANGTTYEIDGSVRRIRDRNGNTIDLIYDSGRLTEIIDSLGRSITISYTPHEDRIDYRGFRDTPRTIFVRYAPLDERLSVGAIGTQQSLFPGVQFANPGEPINPLVVSEVELPTATGAEEPLKYDFEYNPYAELTKVTLPTGGVIEYSWESGVSGSAAGVFPLGAITGSWDFGVHRRVASRTVKNYTIDEQKQQFDAEAYSPVSPCVECWVEVKEYDPATTQLLGRRKHWFVGHALQSFLRRPVDYSPWREGRETQVDIFDKASDVAIRRIYNTWEQRAAVPWSPPPPLLAAPANDVRLTRLRTTLGGVSSKVDYGYDEYNNVVLKQEYDYAGATPARTTETTYMRGPYLAAQLLRLPQEVKVSDAAGERSRVAFTYDDYSEFPLTPRPGIVGWTTPPALRGNVTAVMRHQDRAGEPKSLTTKHGYDVAGNLLRTVDPRSNAIRVFYEDDFGLPNGRLQEQGRNTFAFPTRVVNALLHETRTQYDYFTGKAVDQRDPNGTVTSQYFDDRLDRLTLVVKAANQGAQSYRSKLGFVYDDGRYLRRVTTYGDHNQLGDAYSQHRVRYDELGRETHSSARDPEGSLGSWITVEKAYDARGRLSKVSNPRVDSDPSYPLWTTTAFDVLDRPVEVKTPDGAVTTTAYIDNHTCVFDPASTVRCSAADALGRIFAVGEGVGEGGGALNYGTSYEYDGHDRLTKVTQVSTSGQTVQNRTFTYDALGQLREVYNPESGVVSYKYDLSGNQVWRRDARNVVTSTPHDNINRPIEITYTDGTPAVTFTYDVDSVPGSFPLGRLVKVKNAFSETAYHHDPLGRVFQSSQTTEGVTYSFAYRYDLLGNLVQERYPSGRVVATPHDYLSRVTGVSDATRVFASNYRHSLHGAPVSIKLGNALWETTRFNARFQPILVGLGTVPDQPQPNYLSLAYEYWPGTAFQANNGNVRKQTITAPGQAPMVQTYTYDSVNRLATATETGAWSQTYGYDRFGNRWVSAGYIQNTRGTPTSSNHFDAATNRLAMPFAQFDPSGNLTVDPIGLVSTYDAENRTVTTNHRTVTYRYDGEGRRVVKEIGAEKTVYVYDALGRLTAEYGGPPVFAGVRYLTKDPLGSTRIVTDQSGTVVGRHDFLPFGEEIPKTFGVRSQIGAYEGLDAVRQRFTGKERDFETGRDYFGARYLSGANGRFTSVDPVLNLVPTQMDPQRWNRYSYTRNNPLRFVDITGEDVGEAAQWVQARASAVNESVISAAIATGSPTLAFGGTLVSEASTRITVGFADMFRVGESTGTALGRGDSGLAFAAAVAEDVGRASGLILMLAPTPKPMGNAQAGALGEARFVAEFERQGGQILGGKIGIRAKDGTLAVPDFYGQSPNGTGAFFEVKTGNSPLRPSQEVAYPQIRAGGGTIMPSGGRAAAAGLTPYQSLGPTPVNVIRYPRPQAFGSSRPLWVPGDNEEHR